MEKAEFEQILLLGENTCIEFKRGGRGFEEDAYQTVCSFLNRFGGDLFLGVLDDGTVVGVPEKAARDMCRNFIKQIGNPNAFSPTAYFEPKPFLYEGKTVIHVHIPPSAEVHSYKKEIYDRIDDADVKITATGAIAQLYIRKQNIFTEKKIYPFVTMDDLRLDLLPRIRIMTANTNQEQQYLRGEKTKVHPWKEMPDEKLLQSAGLYGVDRITGEKGINLAGIVLLGSDDVIRDVLPAYRTDALLRRVNLDRYDDREVVMTNLIESYDILMNFGRKHLSDPFYLEGSNRVSLREIILREMIGNLLIHREFTSSYQAKFVIEREKMYTENANRSTQQGLITPENMEPLPKNPIIAAFFRTIGLADQLGSGVRNLFTYSRTYGGKAPILEEKDVFRTIIALDGGLLSDTSEDNIRNMETHLSESDTKNGTKVTQLEGNGTKDDINVTQLEENGTKNGTKVTRLEGNGTKDGTKVTQLEENGTKDGTRAGTRSLSEEEDAKENTNRNKEIGRKAYDPVSKGSETVYQKLTTLFGEKQTEKARNLVDIISENSTITIDELVERTGISRRTINRYMKEMQDGGIIKRNGSKTHGEWVVVGENLNPDIQ